LTKGRITGADFSWGTTQYDTELWQSNCHAATDERMIPFAVCSAADSQCFSKGWTTPKIAPARRDLDSHLMHGSSGQQESAPKWHLDQFIPFCTLHPYDQHADTDHATCYICPNRPHLMHQVHAMQASIK